MMQLHKDGKTKDEIKEYFMLPLPRFLTIGHVPLNKPTTTLRSFNSFISYRSATTFLT